ncbi:hypothetical protein OA949_00505 [Candidatus Pelagibacter sp.]|nr:hypothetical protein [Candidatus Pelagibacter sp.]
MLINLYRFKSNIILFALIFIFITTNVYSKNGYGDLKMNSNVLESFIDYITGVGMDKIGYKKGTPHFFATNNEGTASYYYFCPLKYLNNCMDNDWIKVRRECSKKSKDLGGEKCAVFAKKRKIVWDSKNFTFPKNPDREYIINKLNELGFIDETPLAETFDKTNPDIVEKLSSLKKLYEAGALSKKDFEKAKKKILD